MAAADPKTNHRPDRRRAGAREVVWRTLRAVASSPAVDAQAEVARCARAAGLDDRDQALAFEIVQGVLRWRRRLDAVVKNLSGFEATRLNEAVSDVLRIGVYQHAFLSRIPPHAVVNETVALARRVAGAKTTAFVNAALHQMLRQFPGDREFEALFSSQPADVRWSLPRWLFRLLRREVRERAGCRAVDLETFLRALNEPLALYLRARPVDEAPSFAARLTADGIETRYRPELAPGCLEVAGASVAPVLVHALFREGRLLVQDASAQLAAQLVGAKPGETVIDWCAAPGGKTAALADAMGQSGTLIALDVSEERLRRLHENLARFELEGFVEVCKVEADSEAAACDCEADRVLVDVPCSGLGTLRRHPEIRWRVRRRDLDRLAAEQLAILLAAARRVRPGGRLVYSTCSLAAEENEQVVDRFLEREAGRWEIEHDRGGLDGALCERMDPDGWLRAMPGRDAMDSARAVRLRRTA